jgi:hypothetical protein
MFIFFYEFNRLFSMDINKSLLAIFLLLAAQACGQTGPLYLPDSPPPIYVPKH